MLTQPDAARAAVLPNPPAPIRASLPLSHVPLVVRGLTPLRLTAPAQQIGIDFALKPRNADKIPALLAAISDPRSQMYGHYLTQAEYRARFAPTKAQVDQVVAYAKSQGLTVSGFSTSRMLVHASGTAAQMQQAFGVTLRDYVSPDTRDSGRIFHSPNTEPTVDASVAPLLTGIVGLDNLAVPHNYSHAVTKSALFGAATSLHPNSTRGTGHDAAFSPYDIASLYSLSQSLQTYSGQGQVLGLLEFCSFNSADVAPFESYYPLTTTFPAVIPISVNGFNTATAPNPSAGEVEVTLDIDMMLDLAYNASQIRVYEAPNSDSGLLDEFDAMANDSTPANVISCSWGTTEKYFTQANLQSEANALQQLVLQGQTVCVAAGDGGAYDTGYKSDGLTVDNPGSQPNVVCAGGTNINDFQASPTSQPTLVSQTSWYDAADTGRGSAGAGGGGGVSNVWKIPSWQVGAFSASSNPQGSATMRNTPDISIYGDYDTGGYDIYEADYGGWSSTAGTSDAAPLWASIIADANSERAANGLSNLGLATPQIYSLAESSAYGTDFYDVNDNSTNGYYHAVTGYDNSTGWGTPLNGSQLISDLAAAPANAGPYTLSFSPSTLSNGEVSLGTISLTRPVNYSITFTVTSSDPATLAVPQYVAVNSNSQSGTFDATAGSVAPGESETVNVTATYGDYSETQSVVVNGPAIALSSVSAQPNPVIGGNNSTGTVTLDGNAPADEVIGLSSDNAAATVPSNVTISAGSSSATFPITTTEVNGATEVTIAASDPQGNQQAAYLTVNPVPAAISSISLDPTEVIGGPNGNSTATVSLTKPDPYEDVEVAISNSDSATTVPASVTIPAGETSATFTVGTSAVTTQDVSSVIATFRGASANTSLTVDPVPAPPAVTLRAVTLSPTSAQGGTTTTGNRVALRGTPTTDTVVTLTSSDPGVVSIPSSVTIPANATSRVFSLKVSKSAPAETVTITASYNGQMQTAQINVTPAPVTLKSVVASPTSTEGGTSTTANRVYLTGNANATTIVSLTSSNPAVLSVPKTVTVQQGYSSHLFTIVTKPVAGTLSVTVTATSGGVTQTTLVTVTP